MNSLKFLGGGLFDAFFNFGTPTHNSKKGREPSRGLYNQNHVNLGFYNQSPEAAADDNETSSESGGSDTDSQFESASTGSDSAPQHLRYSDEGSPPRAGGGLGNTRRIRYANSCGACLCRATHKIKQDKKSKYH